MTNIIHILTLSYPKRQNKIRQDKWLGNIENIISGRVVREIISKEQILNK